MCVCPLGLTSHTILYEMKPATLQQRANNSRAKKNDIIYTPKQIALKMIEVCNITPDMKVLDPCYGAGVFYDNLPDCDKHWCEIEKGKDFFSETEKYDLIIGNPPYSLCTKWLDHTSNICDKFCYIFGAMNLTSKRIDECAKKGFGITYMAILQIKWWFAQSIIVIFERNKPTIFHALPTVLCECGKICNRGIRGNSFNECTPKPDKKKKKQVTATITVTPEYYAQITSQEN